MSDIITSPRPPGSGCDGGGSPGAARGLPGLGPPIAALPIAETAAAEAWGAHGVGHGAAGLPSAADRGDPGW